MNANTRKTRSSSKFRTIAVLVLAGPLWTTGKAWADPSAPPAGPLDDAQIVQRVLSVNKSEERIAETVEGKVSTPLVWQLALRMEVDHATLDRRFAPFAAATQQSAGDRMTEGQADAAALAKLSGGALEKAYVGREVKSHERMLAALDQQLIPNAKNEELQRQLVDLRAEVVAHLDHAQRVQYSQSVLEMAAQQRESIEIEVGNSRP
jgi:predicted outer membrane protein